MWVAVDKECLSIRTYMQQSSKGIDVPNQQRPCIIFTWERYNSDQDTTITIQARRGINNAARINSDLVRFCIFLRCYTNESENSGDNLTAHNFYQTNLLVWTKSDV